jgi:hypothetical protein
VRKEAFRSLWPARSTVKCLAFWRRAAQVVRLDHQVGDRLGDRLAAGETGMEARVRNACEAEMRSAIAPIR